MTEQAQAEAVPEETTTTSGKTGLIIGACVAVLMGGLGFAVPFLFPQLFMTPPEEPTVVTQAPMGPPAFIAFDETVVNLNSDRLNRYLRIGITMQVQADDEELVTEQLDMKKAILRSWLISYLADVSMEDIRGAAGQNRLRREIQDHFNSTLFEDGYDRIHDILFEEFNVQ